MQRTGSIVLTLVTVLLLVLIAACVPAPQESTSTPTLAPAPEKVTPITKEITPPSFPEPTPTVEWGIIEIRVTDPPPADVKSVVVYLSNIEVHKVSGNVSDNTSGWIPIIGAPPSFDLMSVIGVEQILGSANITAGSFTQIRMKVTKVEVVTTGNVSYTAEVPSDKLRIVGAFNVQAGVRTVLTLDFDGEKSLIITGKGKALFKPVVKLLIKEGKPEVSKLGISGNETEKERVPGRERGRKP